MKTLRAEKRLCLCCMTEHDVQTICRQESMVYKEKNVQYEAVYFYCDNADELYANELMITTNDAAMKAAYKQVMGGESSCPM